MISYLLLSSSHFQLWGRKKVEHKGKFSINISYAYVLYPVLSSFRGFIQNSWTLLITSLPGINMLYIHVHPHMLDSKLHSMDRKNPAKIGARNSGIAPTAMRLGVRKRVWDSQPASNSQVETRKTRITRADFRRVFPFRSAEWWVVLRSIQSVCVP